MPKMFESWDQFIMRHLSTKLVNVDIEDGRNGLSIATVVLFFISVFSCPIGSPRP